MQQSQQVEQAARAVAQAYERDGEAGVRDLFTRSVARRSALSATEPSDVAVEAYVTSRPFGDAR